MFSTHTNQIILLSLALALALIDAVFFRTPENRMKLTSWSAFFIAAALLWHS
jgi:hypothetical protein